MAATNKQIVNLAIARYKAAMLNEIETRCREYCDDLCMAAINERQTSPQKHNFTGNLITSIVACLYKERNPIYACYAADRIVKAIQVKMTYPYKYVFQRGDYDNATSVYIPEIETNEGWGEDDARDFFQSFRPSGKSLFDIVVAYPTEYAEFVEMQRHTTGIIGTYDHALRVGVSFLKLKMVA